MKEDDRATNTSTPSKLYLEDEHFKTETEPSVMPVEDPLEALYKDFEPRLEKLEHDAWGHVGLMGYALNIGLTIMEDTEPENWKIKRFEVMSKNGKKDQLRQELLSTFESELGYIPQHLVENASLEKLEAAYQAIWGEL